MKRVGEITRAEARVLHELMRDGAINRVIAARLNLSEYTVKSHIKSLLAAARVDSRTAFVVAVFRGEVKLRVRQQPAPDAATKPINHGTYSGFMTHRRREMPMCPDCDAAGHAHLARMRAARRCAA